MGVTTNLGVSMRNRGYSSDADELNRVKCQTTQSLIQSRNNVFILLNEHSVGHSIFQEKCAIMDACLEEAMDAMDLMSQWYSNASEHQNASRVIDEMEQLEQEYSATYEILWKLRKSNPVKVNNKIDNRTRLDR